MDNVFLLVFSNDLHKTQVSPYLCSNSRMDRMTPEVDACCCRVARNVNSLLFRNNWINFSLEWGAAWISLSTAKKKSWGRGRGGEEAYCKNVYICKSKKMLFIFVSCRYTLHSGGGLCPMCATAAIMYKNRKHHLYQCAPFVTLTSSQSDMHWFSDKVSDRGRWAIQVCCEQITLLIHEVCRNKIISSQIQRVWLVPESLAKLKFQFHYCLSYSLSIIHLENLSL